MGTNHYTGTVFAQDPTLPRRQSHIEADNVPAPHMSVTDHTQNLNSIWHQVI